jgi:hypothetical protein
MKNKRSHSKLDGVLALAMALKKTNQKLSGQELLERTSTCWQGMNGQEKLAASIVGNHTWLCNLNRPKDNFYPEMEEIQIDGPEPMKNAKVTVAVERVLNEYRKKRRAVPEEENGEITTQGSAKRKTMNKSLDRHETMTFQLGTHAVHYRPSRLSIRANALLNTPEACQKLLSELNSQRVPGFKYSRRTSMSNGCGGTDR